MLMVVAFVVVVVTFVVVVFINNIVHFAFGAFAGLLAAAAGAVHGANIRRGVFRT